MFERLKSAEDANRVRRQRQTVAAALIALVRRGEEGRDAEFRRTECSHRGLSGCYEKHVRKITRCTPRAGKNHCLGDLMSHTRSCQVIPIFTAFSIAAGLDYMYGTRDDHNYGCTPQLRMYSSLRVNVPWLQNTLCVVKCKEGGGVLG